jgi:putative multidrug resistance efflux pump
MKDFSYRLPRQDTEIEYILKGRKKKIARQQIIFIIILFLLILGIVYYVGYRQYYTELDGYVQVDVNRIRASDDIFVLRVMQDIGNHVESGDTLFSYVFLSNLIERENKNKGIEIVTAYRKSRIELETAVNEIKLTRVKIRELEKQIAQERHNISFGLSNNANKMKLERDLREAKEILSSQQGNMELMKNNFNELYQLQIKSGITDTAIQIQYLQVLEPDKLGSIVRYHINQEKGFVTHIAIPNRTSLFKQEDIMEVQGTDIQSANLYIAAYTPLDKIDKCTYGTPATVIVNDDIHIKAHVRIQGANAVQLPSNLRSNFSRKVMVTLTLLSVDSGQDIPFWALSNGTPVTVRIRNLDVKKSDNKKINIHT